MHNAQLYLRVRVERFYRLRKTFEAIAAGDQNISKSPVFKVNGLITNDKFCFVREVHLQLSRSRVPLNRRT